MPTNLKRQKKDNMNIAIEDSNLGQSFFQVSIVILKMLIVKRHFWSEILASIKMIPT